MKNKTINPSKMLVVRPFRETCLAFYSKFKKFNIDYLTVNSDSIKQNVGNLPENFNLIISKFVPSLKFDLTRLLSTKATNYSWVNIKDVEKYIKTADIVNITDTYYFFNRQVIKFAKKYKKPVVVIIWKTIPNHISSWLYPYSNITKEVVEGGDLFILRCKSAFEFARSIGIKKDRIRFSYKGIDLSHFKPKEVKRIKNNKVTILYVGNLVKSKGLYDLFWAFRKLHREIPEANLVIAGKGVLERRLKRYAKSHKLPIHFLGHVGYLKLADVYRSADIFCSPSRKINFLGIKIWEEYFSYTLMEAQASGLPIITTESKGVLEEVSSENEIISCGDRKALYFSLKKLVKDKKRRDYLSKLNRKRAEKYFDLKNQVKETENLILESFGET